MGSEHSPGKICGMQFLSTFMHQFVFVGDAFVSGLNDWVTKWESHVYYVHFQALGSREAPVWLDSNPLPLDSVFESESHSKITDDQYLTPRLLLTSHSAFSSSLIPLAVTHPLYLFHCVIHCSWNPVNLGIEAKNKDASLRHVIVSCLAFIKYSEMKWLKLCTVFIEADRAVGMAWYMVVYWFWILGPVFTTPTSRVIKVYCSQAGTRPIYGATSWLKLDFNYPISQVISCYGPPVSLDLIHGLSNACK